MKKQPLTKKEPDISTAVALYARVSSDRQDVDLSVAAQLRALRDYAEKCCQSAKVGQIGTREDYCYEELRVSSLRVLL